MVFKGVGQVKWKDRPLVNFELSGDGTFETTDPAIIERLKLLDYKEYVRPKVSAPVASAPVEPAADVAPEAEKPKKGKKGKQ